MKNIARRSAVLLGFIASMSTVLASCNANRADISVDEAPEITDVKNLTATITWWNNYKVPEDEATASKTTYAEYFYAKNVIEEFNKVYPNITVKTENKGSYSEIQKACNTALTAGNTPNIASTYGDSVAGYIAADATLVLDNYVTNETYGFGKGVDADGNIVDDSSTSFSDFNQNYFNAEKNQYAGSHYASLPYSKSSETLVVNQTAFDQVGAGYSGTDTYSKANVESYDAPYAEASKTKYSVPTNWKELIATARKIKQDYPTVFENQFDADGYFTAVPFCYDSGENMIISLMEMMDIPYTSNESTLVTEQVLFNNDKAKDLVVQLKKWNLEGLIATQNQLYITDAAKGYHQYSSTLMANGDCFMCVSSTAGARYFATTNQGTGEYALTENGQGGFIASLNETAAIDANCYDNATGNPSSEKSKVISQGPSLTFFKKANANENVASFLFYKFLTNTDNNAALSSATAYFPLRSSSTQKDSIQTIINNGNTNLSIADSSYSARTSTYTGQAFKLNETYTESNRYFTSPVFDLSSACRTAIGNLVNSVFNDKTLTTESTDVEIRAVVEKAFSDAYATVINSATE